MFSHSYYSLSTGYEWLPDFKERRCFALANGTGQQCYLNCAIQLLLMLPLFNDPDPLIDRRKENLMILSQLQLMSKSTTSTTLTAEELNKRIAEIQTSIVFADLLIAVHLGKEQGDKKLKYILSADPYSADTDNCVRSFWAAVHEGLGTERLIGFDHTQQQDPSHFLQVLLQSPSLGGLGCSRKIDQHDQYDHLSPVLHYCRTTTTTPKYHKTCCVETVQTDCGTLITLDLPPLDVGTSGISFSIALALQRDQEPFDRASDGEVFECRQCEQRFVVGMCHRCEHSGCDMQSWCDTEDPDHNLYPSWAGKITGHCTSGVDPDAALLFDESPELNGQEDSTATPFLGCNAAEPTTAVTARYGAGSTDLHSLCLVGQQYGLWSMKSKILFEPKWLNLANEV